MIDIGHLAFPLRQNPDGTLMHVEQDTRADVRQCVALLLATPLGIRPLAPGVGVDDPTFTSGVDADELRDRLEEQEPRAAITVVAGQVSQDGTQRIDVQVGLADERDDLDPDVT